MGQKVHPVGYRLGIVRDWESRWYSGRKDYAEKLHEDLKLREWILKRWSHAGISKIEIERIGKVIRFTLWTARPGVVIGKGGTEIQKVREEVQELTGNKIMINVQEIKNPDMEAQVVAEGVASALERRVSFRRAMKQSIFRAMKSGAEGIRSSAAEGWAEPRSPGPSGTSRGGSPCRRSGPTSITALPKHARCTV